MAKKQAVKVEEKCDCSGNCCQPVRTQAHSNGAVYGLGVIGAAIYFLPQAHTVQEYLMLIFQSLVWPATLVYRALSLLKINL